MIKEHNLKILESKLKEINSKKTEYDFNDNKTWYKTHRNGNTGIGKTFEDLINKKEDNLSLPDFMGIELKAHDTIQNSRITLFTKSPNSPRGINTLLRDSYGYSENNDNDNKKILHCSVTSKLTFNKKSNHYFKLVNDKKNETIVLKVFDENKNAVKDNFKAEWSYKILENALKNKLQKLAIINSSSNEVKKTKYYSYNSLTIINNLSLKNLLKALEEEKLIIDLRIGVYKKGKNIGKTHDHGTGFRMAYKDLLKYSETQEIK